MPQILLEILEMQYGEAKITIFTTLVKDVKFGSKSFLQYMEANLTTFTYVIKIVIFASPYCILMYDKIEPKKWMYTLNGACQFLKSSV